MNDWFDDWLNEDTEQAPREASTGEIFLLIAIAAIVLLVLGMFAFLIALLIVGLLALVLIKSPIALWATILAAVAALLWWDRERQS